LESENTLADQMITTYGKELEMLFGFIPYFSEKNNTFAKNYDGAQGESNLNFPVFDSVLLDFVKKASKTKLMDRNYPYVYSRNRIRTHEDERKCIERCTIRDVDILRGFLSKYILEGMHRGPAWAEGAREGIYLGVLLKFKELIDFYRRPR